MIMKKHFSKDPEILWDKVLCPVCSQPTGPESDCYNLSPKPKTLNHSTGILPIFSKNCAFRADNLWRATLNYDLSNVLYDKLIHLEGVKKINPLDRYSFQVSISRLSNEIKVKQEITRIFKTFIKEMQSKESSLVSEELINMDNGIIFPNGEKFFSNDTTAINELVANVDGVKKISKKVLENPGKDPDRGI